MKFPTRIALATALAMFVTAPAKAQTAGTYVLQGGSYTITVDVAPGTITVVEPNHRSEYRQVSPGLFEYQNPNSGKTFSIRVINAATMETFKKGDATTPARFQLTNPVNAEQARAIAETNTPDDMYRRGQAAAKGEGSAPDLVEAARWYDRAAKAGHGQATLALGLLYQNGKGGVPRNYAYSAQLIEQAANRGVKEAYAEMAAAHVNGLGVKQDRDLALMWADRAVAAGDPWGHYQAAYAYYVGRQDTRKSNVRMLRAADMGLPRAQREVKSWSEDWRSKAIKDRDHEDATGEGPGGGFMKSVVGAGVGFAAAKAAGASTGQTVGAMAKGVELANPNSDAAKAVGAVGDVLLAPPAPAASAAGSGAGAAPGAPGKPSGVPATYPQKPNAADPNACKGFTDANYMTRAFAKDGNEQLNTMCGQAFDLYHSYLNARQKGYSEADANNTWSAHEKAARVANQFYRDTRSTGGIQVKKPPFSL